MHEVQIKVRFSETDALGHVNNASYFIYLEEARIDFIEHLGQDMSTRDWNFILASVKCDFINQAYFNQQLTIKTYTSKIGKKSFTLQHEIICTETNKLIAKGEAVMVCFDFKNQVSKAISEEVKKQLESTLVYH